MNFSHLEGLSLRTVELDEPDDPVAIGLLSSAGNMMTTQHLTNLIHQL